ncbi:ABC transporter substrate-binding protein [Clostridium weizhouense]|uniref:ABC transporter substrate-binding protein n=1 Tax=Clostridium weizhouense TaxID=2859781 RepID=A0ABS7AU52_9CLOT|nr:ABC transporter substrate-binding protein [Clostridium weizhouense]MBW6411733.1 ABC transporter substrate-binding protein [Clostridium weizhouense]
MKKSKSFLYLASICTISLSIFLGCASNGSKSSNEQVKDNTYKPVTITVDLLRSGNGDKVEETFESSPKRAVTFGDEFTDILLDLGLENSIAGRTESNCKSIRTTFDEKKKDIPVLANKNLSQEKLLSVQPDFAMGWDSNFSDKKFNKDFCKENGIAIYTPKFTGDHATIQDLYTDYITLGEIFNVKSLAEDKVNTMKTKVEKVKDKVKNIKSEPKKVFIYDSGEESPFTGCQGLPGDLIKIAGGKNIFDDIDKAWAHVSWEDIVDRNPEVILIMNYNNENIEEKEKFLCSNPALKDVDAIKNKRIYPIILSDIEGGAGTADVVEDLAKAFYPDVFNN